MPAKILGPLADDSPLKEHQPQRSQWEGIPIFKKVYSWVGRSCLKTTISPKKYPIWYFFVLVNELVIVPAGYLESYSNFEIHIVW